MKQDKKQVLALCLSAGWWYPKDVRVQAFDIEFPVENKAPKSCRVLKISHFGRYDKMEVEISVVPWNMPNKEFVIPYADNMTAEGSNYDKWESESFIRFISNEVVNDLAVQRYGVIKNKHNVLGVDIAFNGDQPISMTLTDNKGNTNTFKL